MLAAARSLWIGTALALPAVAQENVLIVLADDVGVDQLGCYAEGSDLPATPTIDALASQGVLFRNAWSTPMCSPARASILTGRYGFRTGIGNNVDTATGLPLSEWTLPEVLDHSSFGYAHALIGKWHLGSNAAFGGLDAPNVAGWSHFAGALGNLDLGQSYDRWLEVVDGAEAWRTDYPTTVTVDRAFAWLATAPQPWLCVVSFNAPHAPFHAPPPALAGPHLPDGEARAMARPYYRAMLEALDTELGRLLAGLAPQLGNTTVVFAGDNGSPSSVTVPPFDRLKAKLTPYEGGVNVPLIVTGPQVSQPGREVAHLVHLVDLFATVARIAAVDLPSRFPALVHDSVDLLPYLRIPGQGAVREHVYSEAFRPLGSGPYSEHVRTVRDARFKLVRRIVPTEVDELYDLSLDPFEQHDLLAHPPLPGQAIDAYARLDDALAGLHP